MPRHPNVWTRAFALDSRAGFYRLYREELEARPLEELRSALAAGHGTDGVDGSSDSQPPRVLILQESVAPVADAALCGLATPIQGTDAV
jgi:hypothetical protein